MMLVVDGFLVAAVYFALFVMPQAAMLLLLFGFPLIAFVNSYIFTPIFKKYIPEEDKQGHESGLFPPLLDENNKEIEDAIPEFKRKIKKLYIYISEINRRGPAAGPLFLYES